MIDRTWKIAIAVGLTAALCAIVLSFFSGTSLSSEPGKTAFQILLPSRSDRA